MAGRGLPGFLIADQRGNVKEVIRPIVEPGDTLVACGADVGVFTHVAPAIGAAGVVTFEPDRIQIECFRRAFAAEPAVSRVFLIEQGVWSEPGVREFPIAPGQSGESSVLVRSHNCIRAPVTTIDRIARELGLSVNLIKWTSRARSAKPRKVLLKPSDVTGGS